MTEPTLPRNSSALAVLTLLQQARSFSALLERDVRVQRREVPEFLVRTVMQPLLITFVFAYLFPRIGQRIQFGPGVSEFATILVPGLMAVSILGAGISAVALPLSLEFMSKEMEDRLLGPLPILALGVERMLAGSIQALLAALIVFPVAYFVPATSASVQVGNWGLLLLVLGLACWMSGALGLTLGCLVKPQHVGMLFGIFLTPLLFLGCVFYPWQALRSVSWLQTAVLWNPLVYMSEGLRGGLTPQVPHMPDWAFLGGLAAWLLVLSFAGLRLFLRRAVG